MDRSGTVRLEKARRCRVTPQRIDVDPYPVREPYAEPHR
jgi:hypothetical protein